MTLPWYIETLARSGEVLQRQQVAHWPLSIGRAYDNDYLLDDPYVAAHHARLDIDADGALVLHEVDTRNGIVYEGKKLARIPITSNTCVRLGHTTLRLRAANFAVAPELQDRTRHGWEGMLPGLAGSALVALVALLTMWLADTQPWRAFRYLLALSYGLGAGLLWSACWAFGNRLFARHARFGRHLFIFGCGVAALMLFRLASSAIGYAWSFAILTRYGAHVAVLLVAGIVFFHLATISPMQGRRHAIVCALLAILGSGLVLVSNEQRNGRLADELYMSVLLPPALRASADDSIDAFMADVAAMQEKLDRERRAEAPAAE